MDISSNILNSMNDYHSNINVYNENMRRYLHLVEDVISVPRDPIPSQNPVPRPTRRNNTNRILQSIIRNMQNPFVDRQMDDVVVRPTYDEIRNGTQIIEYNNAAMRGTTCPITLEPFRAGDRICQIKGCMHMFKEQAIENWFDRNVRCPVCRYDIRTYREEEIQYEEESADFSDIVEELLTENQPTTQITPASSSYGPNSNINTFSNAIRSFINNEFRHIPSSTVSQFLYTFDIPISVDMSGNYS